MVLRCNLGVLHIYFFLIQYKQSLIYFLSINKINDCGDVLKSFFHNRFKKLSFTQNKKNDTTKMHPWDTPYTYFSY